MASLRDLARDLGRVSGGLTQAGTNANRRTAQHVLRQTRAWSSGTFKQAVFDTPVSAGGLGAPYGHGRTGWLGPRGPIPYGDPAIINEQSGVFKSSWRMRQIRMFGGSAFRVENVASYARYLQDGTTLMVRRPLDDALNEEVGRVGPVFFRQEYEALLKRSLKG
jgi:hypothetical protein